jgi:hypothetical protein
MLVFPQLLTGASAVYPVSRKSNFRTVVNTLPDGSAVVYSDPDAALTEWELRATGLNAAEWNAIDTLFQAVAGQWQTLTFLDPAGNLFADSELLSAGAWTNGPLVGLTAGIGDPLGTTRATRAINAGGTVGAVSQVLAVPGNFKYCLSAWAKTIGGSNVTLTASSTGGSVAKTFSLTTMWQRISLAVSLGQSTTSVTFGAQLDAGASVDLFGLQVEAQLAASDYKRTGTQGGVYANARFAEDGLTVKAQSTDVFDAVIRVVSA